MPFLLAALVLVPVSFPAQDTVIPVERGSRFSFESQHGRVTVTTWDRDAIRLRSGTPGRQTIDVERGGEVIRARARLSRRDSRDGDSEIVVPRWMDIRIQGNQLEVAVRGSRAGVNVATVNGDVLVDGGAGQVSIRTIQGEVTVRNVSGRVDARSVNEGVSLADITGEVYVETTRGDISMRGIRSAAVRATTVNGRVVYQGSIEDDGRYLFASHNGAISIAVPRETNATVTVSAYHGGFHSEFPVQLRGTTRDRQFNFILGSGGARVALESFNGEIRLRRP